MRCIKSFAGFLILLLAASTFVFAQDSGWPRKNVNQGGTVTSYQPQVDDWKDFTAINWRQAFQQTPTDGKQVIGAATFTATTKCGY